jgi:hypothetical protein
VGVGVTGVGVGVGWDVGVGVAFRFDAGADVGFAFGKDVDVEAGKVLSGVNCVPLLLATVLFEVPAPGRRGSRASIAMMSRQAARMIDHFHARRKLEGGRPVSFEATCGGIGGEASYSNPLELPNCEI